MNMDQDAEKFPGLAREGDTGDVPPSDPPEVVAEGQEPEDRVDVVRVVVGQELRHGGPRRCSSQSEPVLEKLARLCKFLVGSFSAVSNRIFARNYAFDSIFQALQDLHTFASLQSQNFTKQSV